jgi:hypothetical protein
MTYRAKSYKHYLNVYGPDDLLRYSAPLPKDRVAYATDLVGIDPSDPYALSSYPVTHEQAAIISYGKVAGLPPDWNVMLEPMAEDDDAPSEQSTTNTIANRIGGGLTGHGATRGGKRT